LFSKNIDMSHLNQFFSHKTHAQKCKFVLILLKLRYIFSICRALCTRLNFIQCAVIWNIPSCGCGAESASWCGRGLRFCLQHVKIRRPKLPTKSQFLIYSRGDIFRPETRWFGEITVLYTQLIAKKFGVHWVRNVGEHV
jgi:hypothetical protein